MSRRSRPVAIKAAAKGARPGARARQPTRSRRDHRQPVARSFGCRRPQDDQARQEARLRHLRAAQRRAALRGGDLRADRGRARDAQRDGHQRRRERGSRTRTRTREDEDDDDEPAAISSRSRRSPSPRPKKSEPGERTDDPVRMYLREMGSVELLSREGEIAIAKRIEAGREAMIAGAVRKPADVPGDHHLARRAERRQGVPARHHRPRSDLCRSRRREGHAAGAPGVAGQPGIPGAGRDAGGRRRRRRRGRRWSPRRRRRRRPRPRSARAAYQPPRPQAAGRTARRRGAEGEERRARRRRRRRRRHGEFALARRDRGRAEAEGAGDASTRSPTSYKRLRRLQDQDIANQLQNESLSPAQERKYKKIKEELVTEVKSLRLNQARIDALVEQLYDINKRLVSLRGPPDAARRKPRRARARTSCKNYQGDELNPQWLNRVSKLAGQGLEELRRARQGPHQADPRRHPGARDRDRPRDRRVPQASSTWCRRASARRARRRRKWSRRTCAS